MASKVSNIISLVIVLMLWGRTEAQSGCTTALIGLSPCLTYISGNSSTPSTTCCSQLSSVVQSQPQCLCSMLNGGSSNLGIAINQTLALALPGACNVQTPPVSRCNGKNSTGTSPTPASSPSDSPADETPEGEGPTTSSSSNQPDIPSGGTGSKTVPSTDGVVGGSNMISAKFSLLGTLLVLIGVLVF
ncbi:hypothetical protein RD792_009437 [Penstemon davidsonii]|uniref:Bifunctional inhibitor/plant lipid transfer protein/seed storage helical domain-containing protein n=1 Tax=Penstemon davidsonii TaxID=160366 RepID=A0ABR0CZA4_9LAMI|nr:hypothetical protein RD792_009437 [Penstemon davidsonii]